MTKLLVATSFGCRVFSDAGEEPPELSGHSIGPFARAEDNGCLAIVDQHAIWHRNSAGLWTHIVTAPHTLQSIAAITRQHGREIYVGGMDEPVMLRHSSNGNLERLLSFDSTPGREEWIANGPPLGIRSIVATLHAVLAAVHVGGIPRSLDHGESWQPTIPVLYDVHEVSVHPSVPSLVAAATAVGLCISQDSGTTWKLHTEGLSITNSLAVAASPDEILFSIQDGPFPDRSQLWRLRWNDSCAEQVRDGLPQYFEGKVDTAWITAGAGRSAVIDRGGNLWLSTSGSTGWRKIATVARYFSGLLLI